MVKAPYKLQRLKTLLIFQYDSYFIITELSNIKDLSKKPPEIQEHSTAKDGFIHNKSN